MFVGQHLGTQKQLQVGCWSLFDRITAHKPLIYTAFTWHFFFFFFSCVGRLFYTDGLSRPVFACVLMSFYESVINKDVRDDKII